LLLTKLARAWNLSGSLFVLGVVAGIDGTKDELKDPKIRGEVDGWVGTSHLGRLVLVVGCAIHHASNDRVAVELAQELSGFLVISNLCELEGNGTGTQVLGGVDSVADGILESTSVLARGLTICNANDQDRLARLAKLGQDDAVDDLLAQLGAEWRETLVSPVGHDLGDLLLSANVSKHVRRGTVVVHEADLDAILVEESCGERDSLHDKLQILDALTLLFESHGATVVNVNDNIVESESDDINRNLSGDVPCSNKLIDLLSGALSSLLNARITRRVEALKALLLNSLL